MICSVICTDITSQNPAWARPLFERQVAMLGQLAEAGLAMALAIKDRAMEAGVEDSAAPAFARTARAVRLTLMLQAQVIKQIQALDSHAAYLAASAARQAEERQRAHVEQIVERIASRRYDDLDDVERLVEEASEWLDREAVQGSLSSRPVSELVALICHDLGLDPGWPFPPRGEVGRDAPAAKADGGSGLLQDANPTPPSGRPSARSASP